MSLIARHLEQISLSSESIATLPFPPPKIFTNALLSTTDITLLIRDTEPHERALFSVPPTPPTLTASTPYPDPSDPPDASTRSRRQTVFNVAHGEVTAGTGTGPGHRAPRRNTAVAAVLGAELHGEVRKMDGKGEVDVEVLLRGVEKLNAVYRVEGTEERVRRLRDRYKAIKGSLGHYEVKVDRLTRELERGRKGNEWDDDEDEEMEFEGGGEGGGDDEVVVTEEDLRKEEEEIRDLERRKRELEDRVREMEKDLGGLLR